MDAKTIHEHTRDNLGKTKQLLIEVEDIRFNSDNDFSKHEDELEQVADMKELILEFGQIEAGIVYEDKTIKDGKKYTLVSGERRVKAITELYEEGLGDGIFWANVIEKPSDELSEQELLFQANAKRDFTTEQKKHLVKKLRSMYLTKKERGRKPKETMREYIGKLLGMAERTVGEYIKKIKEEESETNTLTDIELDEENDELVAKKEKTISDYDNNKELYTSFSERVKDALDINLKFKKNKDKIKMEIVVEDHFELLDLLKKLNLEEYLATEEQEDENNFDCNE